MNHYIETSKKYLRTNKEIIIRAAIVVAVAGAILAYALYTQSRAPEIVYSPARACDMLTPTKAKELLGENVINADTKGMVVSGDIATSKCGYTDTNPDANQMRLAAIAVRAGINDKGVQQNKTEFTAKKPKSNVEDLKDLGDSAYFNRESGQLNILDGRNWIILSYGAGNAPEANTVDDALKLAHKVLGEAKS